MDPCPLERPMNVRDETGKKKEKNGSFCPVHPPKITALKTAV